jgi:hypothetical protein
LYHSKYPSRSHVRIFKRLPPRDSEQEQMTAERVRADHRLYALGQPIEAAPHVGRFSCQPDPWTRRAIQRLQTR